MSEKTTLQSTLANSEGNYPRKEFHLVKLPVIRSNIEQSYIRLHNKFKYLQNESRAYHKWRIKGNRERMNRAASQGGKCNAC